MLDNMAPTELKEAAAKLKATFPHVLIEASGVMHSDPAVWCCVMEQ